MALISGRVAQGYAAGNPSQLELLAQPHRWRRMLEASEHGTVRELAQAKLVNETYINLALRLTLLAPDLVAAILDGLQSEGMTLPGLMAGVEVEWTVQARDMIHGQPAGVDNERRVEQIRME